ncbi:MAG TPA: hypothetical protein VFR07_12180 [Mycobacteriales bacterium]|jgi:hypothetical protein|nr:hypothetical protein [Mycobacteriales bacterium]
MNRALVEEATRRSGVLWLVRDGARRAHPVWHVWHDGAAHLVVDGLEQPVGDVGDGDRVLVVVRSRQRQADRVVQWWATVRQARPGSPAWDELVPLLHAERLNAPDGEAQPARWARESRVLSLTPDGTVEPVPR